MMNRKNTAVAALAIALAAAQSGCSTQQAHRAPASAPAQPPARQTPAEPANASSNLTQVASFDSQVTGVTVAHDGRIFVSFPRWTEDVAVSVAEVMKDGSIRPFPDIAWNAWRNARKWDVTPGDHWVCVQSVVVDPRGALWVLDPAAPETGPVVSGGAKLVKIDLASNKVVKTIAFDPTVAIQASYLNDVRFSLDGKHAYITDSGARGAIVVVDLASGKARRVLDGHPSTQLEKIVVKTDGKPLRRYDGRGVEFQADGIAISPDGRHLYWQALTGKTLYRVPIEALNDEKLSADRLASRVEKVGINGVADGLFIDVRGRMYVSALEEDAVKVRDLTKPGDDLKILVQDKRLRWPDTFSMGPDGALYVTGSHIQDMLYYHLENGPKLRTELWKIAPPP